MIWNRLHLTHEGPLDARTVSDAFASPAGLRQRPLPEGFELRTVQVVFPARFSGQPPEQRTRTYQQPLRSDPSASASDPPVCFGIPCPLLLAPAPDAIDGLPARQHVDIARVAARQSARPRASAGAPVPGLPEAGGRLRPEGLRPAAGDDVALLRAQVRGAAPCQARRVSLPGSWRQRGVRTELRPCMLSRFRQGWVRRELSRLERGVCVACQLDCRELVRRLQAVPRGSKGWRARREELLRERAPGFFLDPKHRSYVDRLVDRADEGNAWNGDHIVPVYKGGGECGVENLRTLCVVCHAKVTAEQARERAAERRRLKMAGKNQVCGFYAGCFRG